MASSGRQVCRRNVQRISGGKTQESGELTEEQMQQLITGMMKVKGKRQPVEVAGLIPSHRGDAFVYFLENLTAGETGFEREESFLQRVDGVMSKTIARAIRDVMQSSDPALQREAASWLLVCCPDIAEQVELPEIHFESVPTLAATYGTGESAYLSSHHLN